MPLICPLPAAAPGSRTSTSGWSDDGWRWRRRRLGAVHRCAASRLLPAYPIAAIRTGQFESVGRDGYHRFWEQELRLVAAR